MSLEVELKKSFGNFKLDVAFSAPDGVVTGLLGASGCGKSVTLRCIAGIETPDAGRIVLNGRTLFDREKGINLSPQERHVGYLFQNYALFPNMTVEHNIAVGVRNRKQQKATAEKLIHALYLEDVQGKYPRQLSGGQQQRVALARILASEPEALLLDEPFSALDSFLKWQVETELSQALEHFPGPVLFVTHSRKEVRRLCRQVCVLSRGKSQAVQPVGELFLHPRTRSACLLSGCRNVSRAAANGMTAAWRPWTGAYASSRGGLCRRASPTWASPRRPCARLPVPAPTGRNAAWSGSWRNSARRRSSSFPPETPRTPGSFWHWSRAAGPRSARLKRSGWNFPRTRSCFWRGIDHLEKAAVQRSKDSQRPRRHPSPGPLCIFTHYASSACQTRAPSRA